MFTITARSTIFSFPFPPFCLPFRVLPCLSLCYLPLLRAAASVAAVICASLVPGRYVFLMLITTLIAAFVISLRHLYFGSSQNSFSFSWFYFLGTLVSYQVRVKIVFSGTRYAHSGSLAWPGNHEALLFSGFRSSSICSNHRICVRSFRIWNQADTRCTDEAG